MSHVVTVVRLLLWCGALLLVSCSHDLDVVSRPCVNQQDCTGDQVCKDGICVPPGQVVLQRGSFSTMSLTAGPSFYGLNTGGRCCRR